MWTWRASLNIEVSFSTPQGWWTLTQMILIAELRTRGTGGTGRDRRHALYVLVGHGRDLTLVLAPALHVLGRGRAPCSLFLLEV